MTFDDETTKTKVDLDEIYKFVADNVFNRNPLKIERICFLDTSYFG